MSFSTRVKEEICDSKAFKNKNRRAFAYGFFLFGREFSKERIEIYTSQHIVLRLFYRLVTDLSAGNLKTEETKRKSSVFYQASVTDCPSREKLINFFGQKEDSDAINYQLLLGDGDTAAFLSGAFLSCGVVTTPDSEYHLEFIPPRDELHDELFRLLSTLGYPPKTTVRRGTPLLYYKESGLIEDLLTTINASNCALEVMEVKIYRDLRNRANRAGNCDSANIDKTVRASTAQLKDIKLLYRHMGEDNMPDDLREIARLRVENQEMSLRELGELLNEPLSRSGVNHRLKRIEQLASEYRDQK